MITDHGSCFCGTITFNIWNFEPQYSVCHCTQCCKWTGSLYASITVPNGNYDISGEKDISWHDQSENAERGFCKKCGSALFWRFKESSCLDIAVGMLDHPEQLKPLKHIFCKSKLELYGLPSDRSPKYDARD
jgi:hypothetical protein